VRNDIAQGLPLIQVDRSRFSRLFELLLKDEIISLPAGSTIRFEAKLVSATPECATHMEIQLQDNGPGLSKEALRMLFDPFMVRTQSPAEYGINLMACYFIVHHHCGRIWADGGEGQGTTFTVRLPVQAREAPPTRQTPEFLQKLTLNEMLWARLSSE
jgi:signal transduction histidine kinase